MEVTSCYINDVNGDDKPTIWVNYEKGESDNDLYGIYGVYI